MGGLARLALSCGFCAGLFLAAPCSAQTGDAWAQQSALAQQIRNAAIAQRCVGLLQRQPDLSQLQEAVDIGMCLLNSPETDGQRDRAISILRAAAARGHEAARRALPDYRPPPNMGEQAAMPPGYHCHIFGLRQRMCHSSAD